VGEPEFTKSGLRSPRRGESAVSGQFRGAPPRSVGVGHRRPVSACPLARSRRCRREESRCAYFGWGDPESGDSGAVTPKRGRINSPAALLDAHLPPPAALTHLLSVSLSVALSLAPFFLVSERFIQPFVVVSPPNAVELADL
jgi:hypothetical protein